ncbi:MAG: hypothetical protein HY900_25415 [Deltaproteobacteria bacterium]|nr:hypothetical protein [Deltaproteobacteria bacterium]
MGVILPQRVPGSYLGLRARAVTGGEAARDAEPFSCQPEGGAGSPAAHRHGTGDNDTVRGQGRF